MGDYHVRFCERLRVKFPLPTRSQTVWGALKTRKTLKKESSKSNEYELTLSIVKF